jgi:type II secretory pathway pseudopilin PulG
MQKPTKALLPIAVLFASTALNVQAATDSERIAALEAQLRQQQQAMQAMQAELQRLKADAAAEQATTTQTLPAPAQPVAATPAATGKPAVAEKKLSMNVYGFVQADSIYDFKRVDPDWEDTLRVTTIPVESGTYGNDGDFLFSVRQSRLGIKGDYGPDVTYKLEAELFGVGSDQGQTTIRLRHAWATYKNFGMGQTWSNFMDIDIFPNTIDYWGPTGMVFYRNQQARYTFPLGSKNDVFAMSLENPDTVLSVGKFRQTNNCDLPNSAPDCESTDSTAEEVFQSYTDVPDLTARYRHDGSFGHAQVAGIVRKLGYERLDTGNDDYEVGWGINTSTGLKTWDADMLKLQVAYGEGIGNYMNDGGLDLAPDSADIDLAGAEAVKTWGLSAYYDHYWNEQWASSIGWSMTDLDTTDGQGPDEFKQGQIASVNLLHYPVDHVLIGSEFSWGEREDVNGATGDDYRIQFSLKVDFDSGDLIRY